MTESKFDKVSASVDGYELSDEELNELASDSDLSETWERYHLIGNVMRDEVLDTLHMDISANVAAEIALEPTTLAPKPRKSMVAQLSAKVVQFSKPLGQMAIAASAAGLMIIGVQQSNMVDNQIVPTQVIQTNPLGGIAEPVSLNYQSNNAMAQKQAYMEQQRRFQALLMDHQQQVKLTALSDDNNESKEEEVKDLSQ